MRIELIGKGPLISLDDDSVYQFILQHAYDKSPLNNEMVALQSAEQLFDCLDALEQAQQSFSAAMLDINMPNANGIDLLGQIKERYPRMAASPVYLLSSVSVPSEVALAKERGAACLYTKPNTMNDYEFVAACDLSSPSSPQKAA